MTDQSEVPLAVTAKRAPLQVCLVKSAGGFPLFLCHIGGYQTLAMAKAHVCRRVSAAGMY
jgi:hypothetical protein